MKISSEVRWRVYDDDRGYFWQVGPDGDGLELVELGYYEDGHKPHSIITLPRDAAVAFHAALGKYLEQSA